MKQAWCILRGYSEWAKFMKAKFFTKVGDVVCYSKGSSMSGGIATALVKVTRHSGWVIGDGSSINLWRDRWGSALSIKEALPDLKDWKATSNCLSELIINGQWNFDISMAQVFTDANINVVNIPLVSNFQDKLVWKPDLRGDLLFVGGASMFGGALPILELLLLGGRVVLNFSSCFNMRNLLEMSKSFSPYVGELWIGAVWGSCQVLWLTEMLVFDETVWSESKSEEIPWLLISRWKFVKAKYASMKFSSIWREANFGVDGMSKRGCLLSEGVKETFIGRPYFLKVEDPFRKYFRFD
ncbi:hypothetical protein GIB67_035058 [Kingdonia uniflora]|uniref:RNase H type-1 domain-containing protein n=1 Tax=Kingdonia uniflora TaxID=39325 RepID=A0A7J7L1P5_9MAGN|nr:hypothetical protein GIB67_035058 [Kingdonia uniflora]